MGGSVSSGRSNDELIDNLVEGHLIKTPLIERVFRCIDRGLYYLPAARESAYRDLAWRDGVIHISAPCIYTRVLEHLELKENQAFLNIGSGTGYLSSLVGLIIGPFGVNHNIELHSELIDYAKQKTIEFVSTSVQFDHFDYCVPKFINGNVMNLIVNSDTILYDRIYVGAGVTESEEEFLSSLLKIDGILVMPLNDSLVKIKRVDEKTFSKKSIMTVSFASLVKRSISNTEPFSMPRLNPLRLDEICRYQIRKQIRTSIQCEFNDYYDVHREKSTFNQNRPKEKESNEQSSDDDDDNAEDSENEDISESNDELPLTRFSRLFGQRNSEDGNLNLENQLRLMIYGHILDAAVSQQSTTTVTAHRSNEPETNELNEMISETESNANQNADDELIMNSEQLISTAAALMEVTESVERQTNQSEARNINIPVNNQSDTNKPDTENMASSIESIEEEDENLNQPTLSSASSSASNSNMIAIACQQAVNRRKRQVSSGYQSTSTDFSSSLNESTNFKLSSDESKKIESDEDHYFDDDNDDEDYPVMLHPTSSSSSNEAKELKPISIDHILKASINANDNSNNCNKLNKESYLKKNLLREKIMQLPVSESLKKFLLYYRKI